jgi:cytoskeletal protein CcmA (bactofilin family)
MQENPNARPAPDAGDPFAVRHGARESVIDQECYFEGTFRTPGNMRIEGTYEGVIECQGTLIIAEPGRVNARIAAGNLTVAGRLQGEVLCESRFELLKSGRASGTIAARTTVVHDGAFFEGEIRMGERADTARDGAGPQRPPEATAQPSNVAPTVPIRRRAAADATQAAEPEQTEADATTEPVSPPKVNGRNQPNAGRDVLPNRTGES